MSSAIGVFAKAPVPGKTKTRLARVIGNEAAAELHIAFLWDTLTLATSVSECVLFSAGEHRHEALQGAAAHFNVRCVPQEGEDLGGRMMNALEVLLENHTTGVLVGSDAPSLPPRALALACSKKLSFGPSTDGGFYLVGADAPPFFAGIEWSTPHTLRDTLAQNPGAEILEPWFDVDEWEDLKLLNMQLALDPAAAPRTRDWLLRNRALFDA